MYDGTEGWVAFRTEANRELLLCSCTNCSPRAIYSTFNSACSATCFYVICHLCVFCFSLVSQNPQVQGPLPCSLVSALFYAFLPKIDVMFVSIYTISSCQSSSFPTYVGLSESLMVSFPDNLQLPCWRLYEIRQTPGRDRTVSCFSQ